MHSKGIIHRDIKAENIMFKYNSPHDLQVKLIDFGSSTKLTDTNSKLHTLVGSPYSIAPEVYQKEYDSQCDMWSIGVLIYYLLSGTIPFHGCTKEALIEKIKRGEYNFDSFQWSTISDDAKDLIKKILVTDSK